LVHVLLLPDSSTLETPHTWAGFGTVF